MTESDQEPTPKPKTRTRKPKAEPVEAPPAATDATEAVANAIASSPEAGDVVAGAEVEAGGRRLPTISVSPRAVAVALSAVAAAALVALRLRRGGSDAVDDATDAPSDD